MNFLNKLFKADKKSKPKNKGNKNEEVKEEKVSKDANFKSEPKKVVKYKKKETPLRENKKEDLIDESSKSVTITVDESKTTTSEEKPKAKKKKKVIPVKRVQKEEEPLFGFEDKDINVGDIVTCSVISKDHDTYYLSIEGSFKEAQMDKNETDIELEPGATFDAKIYNLYDGIYYASKNRHEAKQKYLDKKDKIINEDKVVGKVIDFKDNKFIVDVDGLNCFCYVSNIDTTFVNSDNYQVYLNNEYDFVFKKEYRRNKLSIELCRVTLLNQERLELIKDVKVGDIITVKNLEPNKGGFLTTYNSISVFIPRKEISHRFVKDIEEVLKTFDYSKECEVKVLEINTKNRVELLCSIKQTKEKPFEDSITRLEEGSLVNGKVHEKRDYGLMISVTNDFICLLHKNEMSKSDLERFKSIKEGESIEVRVKDIDFDNKKMILTSNTKELDKEYEHVTQNLNEFVDKIK